jgi:hypothetical protein
MASYLSSVEKHMFDIPCITFNMYNNIVVPSWVDLDPCLGRGAVEVDFRILKKVSMIWQSFPSSYCLMHLITFPPWHG